MGEPNFSTTDEHDGLICLPCNVINLDMENIRNQEQPRLFCVTS